MTWDSMKHGSVERMLKSLDRDAIAAARERRYRNRMRRLSPRARRFVRVLRHVLERVKGPRNLQREEIMKRLKIKDTVYYEMRSEAEKNLVLGA